MKRSILLKAYNRLLIDTVLITKCTMCAPDDVTLNWVLIEGPSLGKKLQQYLAVEDHLLWQDFGPPCPEWLSPLWNRFLLLKDPELLRALMQLLMFGYKASFEPSKQQIADSLESFINTDAHLKTADPQGRDWVYWASARAIVSRIIGDIDWKQIIPAHGPGAVYPSFDPVCRSDFNTIRYAIENYYPFWDYFFGTPDFYPGPSKAPWAAVVEDSSPIRARLVAVPKDSRGPRLICVHPRESIWIQQGQRGLLEEAITRRLGNWINFQDQTINGSLALTGSIDGSFSTIDLKDASDNLSCEVVKLLFGSFSYDILSCSRASEVQLLDGRVLELKKWAPMGNALCFPVESLCFFAAVHAGIWMVHGSNVGYCSYVFGDDIIVPTKYIKAATVGLERAGLKVNKAKTFSSGFFRESCGVEAYRGLDVTPLRIKEHRVSTTTELISLCDFAKSLRLRGYEETSAYLYAQVTRVIGRLSMTNNPNCSGVCEFVNRGIEYLWLNEPSLFWSEAHHCYKTRCLQVRAEKARKTGDRYHLLDSLLSLERRHVTGSMSGLNNPGSNSSLSYTVPRQLSLKRGWIPAFYGPMVVGGRACVKVDWKQLPKCNN